MSRIRKPTKTRPVNLPLFPTKPPTFGHRLYTAYKVYSCIATLLFSVWLVVPAIADGTNDTPRSDFPWTIVEPLVWSCGMYGGFEFRNELYSCHHAGTLGGDLRMPFTMSIKERQARLRKILPDSIWGYWINP